MAQPTKVPKRTINKKTTTRAKTTRTKKKSRKPSTKNSKNTSTALLKYELILLLILTADLFIMVSIYLSKGGLIGNTLRNVFFGLFGISGWLLPLAIFVTTFIKIFNRGNERLNIKIRLVFLMLAFIAVTAHVFYQDTAQIFIVTNHRLMFFQGLTIYFYTSSSFHVAGGLIGGLIGDCFILLLGSIGAKIALIAIFISLLLVITEQSFIFWLQKIYSILRIIGIWALNAINKIWNKHQEKVLVRKEERERKKEQISAEKAKRELEEKISKQDELNESFEDQEIVNASQDSEKNGTKDEQRENYDQVHNLKDSLNHLEEIPKKKERKSTTTVEKNPVIESDSIHKDDVIDEKEFDMKKAINNIDVEQTRTYQTPPLELLNENPQVDNKKDTYGLLAQAEKLEETLLSFGVKASVLNVSVGPSVTRFEVQPAQGVKVSKIVNLADDIALNLAAAGIRMEAPIPGKSAVGIEVPNKKQSSVYLRDVLSSENFEKFSSDVAFGLGKDISGNVVVADIGKMPHLLIAGATGSGKSVCINTLITSILYKSSPDEVKLLMIDPKVVELSVYNGVPHLLIPVVTDPKKAAGALNWAVQEMLDRYQLFAASNVRDIKGYNRLVKEKGDRTQKELPQIVIIVDELSDLMVAASKDVEEAICRLAQMARAAGLHLVIATQRPSVDVITGLIKANIPSRIAFNVSSSIDSRTILDMNGAEKLLGKGDMLFFPVGNQKPLRIQGAFISDQEVEKVVDFLKEREDSREDGYAENLLQHIEQTSTSTQGTTQDLDEYFEEALELCLDKQKASASMIQRYFRVGYNRAARILDQLCDAGYVGDDEGSKPRKMLLTKEAWEAQKKETANQDTDSGQKQTAQTSADRQHYE